MTQKSLDKNYWSELPEMTELKNGPEKTRSSWLGLFPLKLTCWPRLVERTQIKNLPRMTIKRPKMTFIWNFRPKWQISAQSKDIDFSRFGQKTTNHEFWWNFMNETEFLDIQNVNLQIKSECGNRKQTRNGDWRQYIEPTNECLRIHSSKLVKDTQNILNIFIK